MTNNARRFPPFSGLMHESVMIAGPFFVPYIIQDIHLSCFGYGGWLPVFWVNCSPYRPGANSETALGTKCCRPSPVVRCRSCRCCIWRARISAFFWQSILGAASFGPVGIGTSKLCVQFGQAGRPRKSRCAIQQGQCHRMVGWSVAREPAGRAPSRAH